MALTLPKAIKAKLYENVVLRGRKSAIQNTEVDNLITIEFSHSFNKSSI